jgi:hypothetical protein
MFSVHLTNRNGFKVKVLQLKRVISTSELPCKLMKGCFGGRLKFEELQPIAFTRQNVFIFSRYITAPQSLPGYPSYSMIRDAKFVLPKINRMQKKACCGHVLLKYAHRNASCKRMQPTCMLYITCGGK